MGKENGDKLMCRRKVREELIKGGEILVVGYYKLTEGSCIIKG